MPESFYNPNASEEGLDELVHKLDQQLILFTGDTCLYVDISNIPLVGQMVTFLDEAIRDLNAWIIASIRVVPNDPFVNESPLNTAYRLKKSYSTLVDIYREVWGLSSTSSDEADTIQVI
jgi:hypothetical protein